MKTRDQLDLFQLDLFSAVLAEPTAQPAEAPDEEPEAPEPAEPAESLAPTNGHKRPRRKPAEEPPLLKPPAITGTPADRSFTDFFLEHGRVPMIHDERKPWTYRGWLFWYRMECETARPDLVPPRWWYWFETMDSGKLLDMPIPRIEFTGNEYSGPGVKHVDDLVNLCARELSDFNRIDPLLNWMMFALGLEKELPNFPDRLHERLYRTLNLEHFLTAPCDYFGAWIGANKGRWNPTAFFATPHNICEMMAQMVYGDDDCRAQAFNEPAIGTGRMALHASNHCLRLYGQDVDHTVLLACKLNGMLYAPWLVKPFPEEFFVNPTPLAVTADDANANTDNH